MNCIFRKPLLVSPLLIVTFAATVLVSRAQNPPQASAPPAIPKTASQQFKNIQVLKDVPADQLIPAMQFITASLGVECEYCHVEKAFDKDDKKPKVTARKMMEMMITINNENFESHRMVTCYTCHEGGAHPVSIPVIAEHEKKSDTEAGTISATGNPAPESLLDQYLAAVGGADALKKINTRVAKGNVIAFGDQHMPVDIYAKAPDMRVSVMHTKARMDADLAFAADVKPLYTKWETLPGEKIAGHDTWLVVGHKEGEPPLKLYLDQESNLLLRLVRYTDSPLGYNPTQIDYADYRAADGIRIPYRWTIARPGNRFTIQVEQLQQNVPVDDAKFVPPPPTPPPTSAPAH